MKRLIQIAAVTIIIMMSMAIKMISYADTATFSSAWKQDTAGVWHAYRNEQLIQNAWLCDDAVVENGLNVWYLLDPVGNMVSAGLVQDGTGNFYSLETNHDGYFGMLRYKSGNYNCNGQTVYLELESTHNGSFAAIKNQSAIDQLMAIYGLTSVANINNSNIVSTSTWIKTATKSTGGPGGGGGSSGGGGGASSGSGSSGSTSRSYSDYDMDDISGDIGDYSVSSEKRAAVNAVIEQFKRQYITSEMIDFEKEMVIIQWMVENIDYDYDNYKNKTIPADSYTSYGALVKKECVCDGYAHAFVDLCKACGLTAIRVANSLHAWNMIRLEGDWYNVDVTWEDPIIGGKPNKEYGFSKLVNKYINLTDEEIGVYSAHRTRYSNSAEGKGTKYGHIVVTEWIKTGEVKNADVLKERASNETEQFFFDAENNGIRVFYYVEKDTFVSEVVEYLSNLIDNRETAYVYSAKFYVRFYSGSYKEEKELQEEINEILMRKYGDILTEVPLPYFLSRKAPDESEYHYGSIYLKYQFGKGAHAQVNITYTDRYSNEVVGTQSLLAEIRQPNKLSIPEGYTIYSGYAEGLKLNESEETLQPTEQRVFDINIKCIRECEFTIEYKNMMTGETVYTEKPTAIENTTYNIHVPKCITSDEYYIAPYASGYIESIQMVKANAVYTVELRPMVMFTVRCVDNFGNNLKEYQKKSTFGYGFSDEPPVLDGYYRWKTDGNRDKLEREGMVITHYYYDLNTEFTLTVYCYGAGKTDRITIPVRYNQTIDLCDYAPEGYELDTSRTQSSYTLRYFDDDSINAYYKVIKTGINAYKITFIDYYKGTEIGNQTGKTDITEPVAIEYPRDWYFVSFSSSDMTENENHTAVYFKADNPSNAIVFVKKKCTFAISVQDAMTGEEILTDSMEGFKDGAGGDALKYFLPESLLTNEKYCLRKGAEYYRENPYSTFTGMKEGETLVVKMFPYIKYTALAINIKDYSHIETWEGTWGYMMYVPAREFEGFELVNDNCFLEEDGQVVLFNYYPKSTGMLGCSSEFTETFAEPEVSDAAGLERTETMADSCTDVFAATAVEADKAVIE